MDQEHFHIWLQRSGGFAGMITEIEIDSRELDLNEENVPDHLRNLITYILKKGRKK